MITGDAAGAVVDTVEDGVEAVADTVEDGVEAVTGEDEAMEDDAMMEDEAMDSEEADSEEKKTLITRVFFLFFFPIRICLQR